MPAHGLASNLIRNVSCHTEFVIESPANELLRRHCEVMDALAQFGGAHKEQASALRLRFQGQPLWVHAVRHDHCALCSNAPVPYKIIAHGL